MNEDYNHKFSVENYEILTFYTNILYSLYPGKNDEAKAKREELKNKLIKEHVFNCVKPEQNIDYFKYAIGECLKMAAIKFLDEVN